jgi:hypothetical protein
MKKTIEQEIADITEILISISLLTLLPPVKKVFGSSMKTAILPRAKLNRR